MGLRGTVELCLQCCDRFIEVDVFRKSQCSEMAPIFTQRFEKKYGVDENVGIPRCLMAAKFNSATDPTGEKTLSHWIAQGQIQDLHQVFSFLDFKCLEVAMLIDF